MARRARRDRPDGWRRGPTWPNMAQHGPDPEEAPTTSASDRSSEKAIERSASCCSASIAAKLDCREERHGLRRFLVSGPAARRATPPLVKRSGFSAHLLVRGIQLVELRDPHRAVGEAGDDLQLAAHGFNESP